MLHPALESCPGHEFWKRDFSGSSSLFALSLKDRTRPTPSASSIGSTSSESATAGADSKAWRSRSVPSGLRAPNRKGPYVRLHVGLEDPQDLIDDLAKRSRHWAVDRSATAVAIGCPDGCSSMAEQKLPSLRRGFDSLHPLRAQPIRGIGRSMERAPQARRQIRVSAARYRSRRFPCEASSSLACAAGSQTAVPGWRKAI